MSRETLTLVEVSLLKAFAISLITMLITIIPSIIVLIVTKPEEWIAVLTVIFSTIAWIILMSIGFWKFCFKKISSERNEE